MENIIITNSYKFKTAVNDNFKEKALEYVKKPYNLAGFLKFKSKNFIFYKYLSEKMHVYADEILKPDGIFYAEINEPESKGRRSLAG